MAQVFQISESPRPRRSGNHHPNLWSDDFIQSLTSPYGDSSYNEHREVLINEIRDILFHGEEQFSVFERISFVDVLQRLGIDRYFPNEIKMLLDHIYKYWSNNNIDDLNMAALGFRILRLTRYDVSSNVFQKLKGGDWQSFGIGHSYDETNIIAMLNLYKASELDFPNEMILQEIRVQTTPYLQQVIKGYEDIKEKKSPLLMEVDYTLKYPWRSRVPRWEAWNFIEMFRKQVCNGILLNNIYRIPSIASQKLLQLAILDFNILQSQHQIEMKSISTWWKHSRANQLDFFRHRHIEFYFWWTSSLFELEYSATRIGTTKLSACLSLLDDIYDTYGTIDELKPFTMTLLRWDSSAIDNLPEYLKIAFDFAYEIHKEIANEAQTNHGLFVHKYIQSCWESYISAYTQEAEWIDSDHMPSFEKYLANGVMSVGMRVLLIHSLILMKTPLSDAVLEQLDIPSSKLQALVSLTTRLVDDIKDFEDEKAHGENASSLECYMKENHGSTREQGLDYIKNYIESCVQELNEEFLKPSNIPDYCRNLYFNGGMRGIFFLFREVDGFTYSNHQGIQDAIKKILVEPIIPFTKI